LIPASDPGQQQLAEEHFSIDGMTSLVRNYSVFVQLVY